MTSAGGPIGRCVLGFSFAISTGDEELAAMVDALFADLPPVAEPEHLFAITGVTDKEWSVQLDRSVVVDNVDHAMLASTLVWLVNQRVVAHPGGRLLFHAAAVAHGDNGALLAAPSGGGKSTLAAGLISLGLSYLSDEVGVLELPTLRLSAYPKPLSLGPGSLAVLEPLWARPDGIGTSQGPSEHQVAAGSIRPASVVASAAPCVVIFPEGAPGSVSELGRLSPVEALPLLVKSAFNLAERPQAHLDACTALCRSVPSYRLVVGDLAEACSLVLGLVGYPTLSAGQLARAR